MSGATQWTPALAFLVVGLLAGAFVIWLSRSRRASGTAREKTAVEPEAVRDLEARLDGLIEQLRELDDEAGKRTLEQLARERQGLELEAARCLRDLDGARQRAARERKRGEPKQKGEAVAAPTGSTLRGFLWGVGSIAVVGLLLYLASQSSRPRDDASTSQMSASGAPGVPDDAEVARLRAVVAAHPDETEARVELARALLERNDMMGVFEETQAVLERAPDEPHALTYQAVVRLAMGQTDQAEAMLKRAAERDPGLIDAHIYLMLTYTELGRDADADAALAAAIKNRPDHAESLRGLLEQMRREAAARDGGGMPEGMENPHAGLETPGGTSGGPAPEAARSQDARSISGTLDLAPSARGKAGHGGVLYLVLRSPGEESGPPLAVRRLAVGAFPMSFSIGAADSMTGGDVPDVVALEVRMDADGDAATRSPDEPAGRLGEVRLGTRDVHLLLEVKP
jgi:tetratricopeptide (TPR) repeat protein